MRFDKVAVTGGTGRLGRYVVAALEPHCTVKVLDLDSPPPEEDFAKADVLVPTELQAGLQGADAVIHLAGIDLDSPASPDAFLRTNAVGTWNVLEAALEAGVRRVVVCSSVSATGLSESRPDFMPHYLPVDEDHPMSPAHPYSVSKQLVETVAASFRRQGRMEVLSLRLMLVGFTQNFDLVRQRIGEPHCRWLFYHVGPEDAAQAFLRALETEAPAFDTYFITAADSCHPRPTLDWLQTSLGTLPEIRKPSVYQEFPRASVFDGSRAREDLGFLPRQTWNDLCPG